MSTLAALVTRGLTKRYKERTVVDHLDLRVPQGSVFGFLGRNGAGKTTTIRMALGLARPSGGSVEILGHDASGALAPGVVGYLPDVPGFRPWMRAGEVLAHAGRVAGLEGVALRRRTATLLDLAGLTGVDQPVGAYSRGMRQRLGLARALVSAPRLLIMDEPTSALDPVGRREVLDLIATLHGRTTVLLSTHLLDDAERVCDEVTVIDHGRLLLTGATADLVEGARATSVEVETVDDAAPLAGLLAHQPWAQEVESEGPRLRLRTRDPQTAHRRLPGLLEAAGCGLVRLGSTRHGLEEVFLRAVGQAGPGEVDDARSSGTGAQARSAGLGEADDAAVGGRVGHE